MDDQSTTISSANGQAYRAYLERAQNVLNHLTVVDYYQSPLPSPADTALAEIVGAFSAWPVPVREGFITSVAPDKRGLFAIFGHRAATLAVRNGNPEELRLGIVGNSIANCQIPYNRNVDAALAVFYHCARKLELDPQELFEEVAHIASDEMATRLLSISRRTDVTLKEFGWREIKTSDGVRYKFEW